MSLYYLTYIASLAWSLAKYDHVQSLIGTTNPDHLQSAIDALQIAFTKEDIARIENAIPADKLSAALIMRTALIRFYP